MSLHGVAKASIGGIRIISCGTIAKPERSTGLKMQNSDYKVTAKNVWESDLEITCNRYNAEKFDFKPLTEWGTFSELYFAIEQLITAGKQYFIESKNGNIRDDETGNIKRKSIIRIWTAGNIPRAHPKEIGQLPL